MNRTGSFFINLLLLVLIASLYRIMPGRPWGFAPQVAMAIFSGAVIKDKRLAFLLPLVSMFVSDALYEVLYRNGVGNIQGFYDGQIINYVLFCSMTVFGFMVKRINVKSVAAAALGAPISYFLLSNLVVWIGGGGYGRPKTLSGLMMCYNDGLPFLTGSIAGSIVFSAILFGSYQLYAKRLTIAG
jgi:hypothetical protein